MIKKLLSVLTVILAFASPLLAEVGDWRVHPTYVGSNFSNIIDTDSKVYFLVGNELFCHDKTKNTTEPLNSRVNLNDVLVTNIYYNPDKKYLVVTYLNSNMDIIDKDGQVYNLPDIKDAVLAGAKGINDITFATNKMYVATEFGMVVYDDRTFSVIESRLFDVSFTSATQVGKYVVVARDNKLCAALVNANNETAEDYVPIKNIADSYNAHFIAVDNKRFIVNCSRGLLAYTITDSQAADGSTEFTATNGTVLATNRATIVQKKPDGFIASYKGANYYVTCNAGATNAQQVTTAKELFSASPNGDGTLWSLSANGLRKAGTTTYYKPNGIGISVGAFYLTFNKEKNLVYLSSTSDNLFAQWGSTLGAITQIFTFDGSQWQDVTPSNLPDNGKSANWQLIMDPLDPDTYVYSSRKYGVFKIKNNQLVYKYDASNSYFGSNYYRGSLDFDSAGNLWVVYSSNTASAASVNVSVLPRAKYEQATCTKSDWIPVSVPATKQKAFNGASFVVGKDDVKVFNSGNYQQAYVFWKETGDLSSTPLINSFTSLSDEDGNNITWTNVYCMVKDLNGIVWTGMNNGIVAFAPSQAFGENFAVIHPKVMRADGTNLYDHLLDGLQVNCIAVDANNCKWIGTNEAGLYQVSPDGSKILNQFNTDNSYLPSNTIYAVTCNTNTNSVFALTPNGFVEYMSEASPAATSYDNVYVYPNPVKPDFTGLLTISELMNNSFITIRDINNNVVKQWQSTGGMATWDCCDETGERMATGLYSVYASQQQNDNNPKKVAEFLIIK